jgi:hypothetical protein
MRPANVDSAASFTIIDSLSRYLKEGPYSTRPARQSILIACDGDEKSSTHDVREEHAKVDPVYVVKASVGRPSCT